MFHHRPKKKSNECQTDLQCTPFILNENETGKVQSSRQCQTEIHLSPKTPDTELYKVMPYIDEDDIDRDAMRCLKIEPPINSQSDVQIPCENDDSKTMTKVEEHYKFPSVSNSSSSSVGIFKSMIKKILKEDDATQTDLMVAPHILNDNEQAIISINTSCQTSLTCSPRTSVTNLVPMLTSYWAHQGETREAFNKTENVLEILKEIIQDVIDIHKHMFDPNYNLPIMNPVLVKIEQKNSLSSSEKDTFSTRSMKKTAVDISGDVSQSELDSSSKILKPSAIQSLSTVSEVTTYCSSDFTLSSTKDDDDDDVSEIISGIKKKYSTPNGSGKIPNLETTQSVSNKMSTDSLKNKSELEPDVPEQCTTVSNNCVCSGMKIKLYLKDEFDNNSGKSDRVIEMKIKPDLQTIEIKKLLNITKESQMHEMSPSIPFQEIEKYLTDESVNFNNAEDIIKLLQNEAQDENKSTDMLKCENGLQITINVPKSTALNPQTLSEEFLQSFMVANFNLKDAEKSSLPEILNKVSVMSKTCPKAKEGDNIELESCVCGHTEQQNKNQQISETISPFTAIFSRLYEDPANLIPFGKDEKCCGCQHGEDETVLCDVEYEKMASSASLDLKSNDNDDDSIGHFSLKPQSQDIVDTADFDKVKSKRKDFNRMLNSHQNDNYLKDAGSFVIEPQQSKYSSETTYHKKMYKKHGVNLGQTNHDTNSITFDGHVYHTDSFFKSNDSDNSDDSPPQLIEIKTKGSIRSRKPQYLISYEEHMYKTDGHFVSSSSDTSITDADCICDLKLEESLRECPHCFRRIGPQYGRDLRILSDDYDPKSDLQEETDCSLRQSKYKSNKNIHHSRHSNFGSGHNFHTNKMFYDQHHPDDYMQKIYTSTNDLASEQIFIFGKGSNANFKGKCDSSERTHTQNLNLKDDYISENTIKRNVRASQMYKKDAFTKKYNKENLDNSSTFVDKDDTSKEEYDIIERDSIEQVDASKNYNTEISPSAGDTTENVHDKNDVSKYIEFVEKVYPTGKVVIGKMNDQYLDETKSANTRKKSEDAVDSECNICYRNMSCPKLLCEVSDVVKNPLNQCIKPLIVETSSCTNTVTDEEEKYKLTSTIPKENLNQKFKELSAEETSSLINNVTNKEEKYKSASETKCQTCPKAKFNQKCKGLSVEETSSLSNNVLSKEEKYKSASETKCQTCPKAKLNQKCKGLSVEETSSLCNNMTNREEKYKSASETKCHTCPKAKLNQKCKGLSAEETCSLGNIVTDREGKYKPASETKCPACPKPILSQKCKGLSVEETCSLSNIVTDREEKYKPASEMKCPACPKPTLNQKCKGLSVGKTSSLSNKVTDKEDKNKLTSICQNCSVAKFKQKFNDLSLSIKNATGREEIPKSAPATKQEIPPKTDTKPRSKELTFGETSFSSNVELKSASETKNTSNEIETLYEVTSYCSSIAELDDISEYDIKPKNNTCAGKCNSRSNNSGITLQEIHSVTNFLQVMKLETMQSKCNLQCKRPKKYISWIEMAHISSHKNKQSPESADSVEVLLPAKSKSLSCACSKSVCPIPKEMEIENSANIKLPIHKPVQYRCSDMLEKVKQKLENISETQLDVKEIKDIDLPTTPHNSFKAECKCIECVFSKKLVDDTSRDGAFPSKCRSLQYDDVQKIIKEHIPCACSSTNTSQEEEKIVVTSCDIKGKTVPCPVTCNQKTATPTATPKATDYNKSGKYIMFSEQPPTAQGSAFKNKYPVEMEIKNLLNDQDLYSTVSISTQPKVRILETPKYIYNSSSTGDFILNDSDSKDLFLYNSSDNFDDLDLTSTKQSIVNSQLSINTVLAKPFRNMKIMNIHKLDGKYSIFSIERKNETGASQTTVYILPNAIFSSLLSIPAPHFLKERTDSEIDDIFKFSYIRNIHYARNPEFYRNTAAVDSSPESEEFLNIIADQNLPSLNCSITCSCSSSAPKSQEQQTDEQPNSIKIDKTTSVSTLLEENLKQENETHSTTSTKTNSIGIQSSCNKHLESFITIPRPTTPQKVMNDNFCNTEKLLDVIGPIIPIPRPATPKIMNDNFTNTEKLLDEIESFIPISRPTTPKKIMNDNFCNTEKLLDEIDSFSPISRPTTPKKIMNDNFSNTEKLLDEIESSPMQLMGKYITWKDLVNPNFCNPIPVQSAITSLEPFINYVHPKVETCTQTSIYSTTELPEPRTQVLTIEASTSTGNSNTDLLTSSRYQITETLSRVDMPFQYSNIIDLKKYTFQTPLAANILRQITSPNLTLEASTSTSRNQVMVQTEEPSTSKLPSKTSTTSISKNKFEEEIYASTSKSLPYINTATETTSIPKFRPQTLPSIEEASISNIETDISSESFSTKTFPETPLLNIAKIKDSLTKLKTIESYTQIPREISALSLPLVESLDSEATDTDKSKKKWSYKQELHPSNKFMSKTNSLDYSTSSKEKVSTSDILNDIDVSVSKINLFLQNQPDLKSYVDDEPLNLSISKKDSSYQHPVVARSSNSTDLTSIEMIDTELFPNISMPSYSGSRTSKQSSKFVDKPRNFYSLSTTNKDQHEKLNLFDKYQKLGTRNTKLGKKIKSLKNIQRDGPQHNLNDLESENLLSRTIDAYTAYLTLKKGISSNFNVSKIDLPYQHSSRTLRTENTDDYSKYLDDIEEKDDHSAYRLDRRSSLIGVRKMDSSSSFDEYLKPGERKSLKISTSNSLKVQTSRDIKTEKFLSKTEEAYSKLLQRKLSPKMSFEDTKDLKTESFIDEQEIYSFPSTLKENTSYQSTRDLRSDKFIFNVNESKLEEEITVINRDSHHSKVNDNYSIESEYSDIFKRRPISPKTSKYSNDSIFSIKKKEGKVSPLASIEENEDLGVDETSSPFQFSDLKSDKFLFKTRDNYTAYLEREEEISEKASPRKISTSYLKTVLDKKSSERINYSEDAYSIYLKHRDSIQSPRKSASPYSYSRHSENRYSRELKPRKSSEKRNSLKSAKFIHKLNNSNTANTENSATSKLSSFVRNGTTSALLSNIGDSPQQLSMDQIYDILPEITVSSHRVLEAVQTCEQRLQPIKNALKDIKVKLRELNMPEVNGIFQNDQIDNKTSIYLPEPPPPLMGSRCSYRTKMTFQLKKPIKPLSVTANVNPFAIKHKYILNPNYSSVSAPPYNVQRSALYQPFHSQRYPSNTYVEELRKPVEVIEEQMPFSSEDAVSRNKFGQYQYLPDTYEMYYYQPRTDSLNNYVMFDPNEKNSRSPSPGGNLANTDYHHKIQNRNMYTGDYPVWKNKQKK